ncbi:MAG: DUF362 domain-containing protein [Candidatus Aminicenantes bacterium]|nr:DUF362 domain-containing protein [Candidatus Aminicenantes bacterium]
MKRREALKDIALGGLVLGLGRGAAARPRHGVAAQTPSPAKTAPDLSVISAESPAAAARAAVAALGGMAAFVGRGDKVIIKPNIGWDRTPEMAACTNPEVVAALVGLVLEAGAKEAVVMDNTTNQAKRCYVRSGIAEAAKQAGAKVLFTDDYRLKKTALQGAWLKEWDVFADFLEADKVINVPIAKVHSLTRLSMGMKNWLGAIGGARHQLHQKLDEAMVDLAAFFKPALTVLDAYRILVKNGPQGGRLSDTRLVKTIIAGRDQVAVDAFGATLFDVQPGELAYLRIAQERGLGRHELGGLTIEKRTV